MEELTVFFDLKSGVISREVLYQKYLGLGRLVVGNELRLCNSLPSKAQAIGI